jgi:hypothetical protein
LVPTRLKLWRNLTDVFYRCSLAILHDVILAEYDVFIDFSPFSKTNSAFPNITMDVQRLNRGIHDTRITEVHPKIRQHPVGSHRTGSCKFDSALLRMWDDRQSQCPDESTPNTDSNTNS